MSVERINFSRVRVAINDIVSDFINKNSQAGSFVDSLQRIIREEYGKNITIIDKADKKEGKFEHWVPFLSPRCHINHETRQISKVSYILFINSTDILKEYSVEFTTSLIVWQLESISEIYKQAVEFIDSRKEVVSKDDIYSWYLRNYIEFLKQLNEAYPDFYSKFVISGLLPDLISLSLTTAKIEGYENSQSCLEDLVDYLKSSSVPGDLFWIANLQYSALAFLE